MGRLPLERLAPADLPKAGSAYDLPIALGVLAAAGSVPPNVGGVVALGKLALDGAVRSARGGLGAGIARHDAGTETAAGRPHRTVESKLAQRNDTPYVRRHTPCGGENTKRNR